ncbi:MAG: hypothetical protein N4A48_08455 [Tepidibacter sp.]|jgi:hypothetical protein|uniref:DUF6873 family GME fold protein n=1 Tax=Tepidibacter sp. TaxID=2529387 RepID=UPI0025CC2C09|nr:hypothetical protein [Tepidibacter sp.]MCT4508778.1 hypothetical protein [Tepidibacter sp.]
MKFLDRPFIPKEKVSHIIIDRRIPKNIEYESKNRNIEIIKTCECKELYEAVKYHADMQMCYLGKGDLVVAPNLYEKYKNIMNKYRFNIIKGTNYIKNKYPYNISYNVALFGEYAIHNFKYTDKNIVKYINDNNIKKINVKQGYCKCCICIVDQNSIITSDVGIYKEVLKYNEIDCLLIQTGSIDLFNMNYGFIGGVSGILSCDELAFLGDIKKHPDYNKIKEFVNKRGKKIISLGTNKLIDLGSIIPVMTRKE